MWPVKSVKDSDQIKSNHVFCEVLIRISSNLMHGFIVSCQSICG